MTFMTFMVKNKDKITCLLTTAAVLPTGIEVQVSEYLETGEVIKVNTVTGKYMSRA
ncbi:hypothetical protein [Methyloprofundus sp.]|uniref:hypothetical protein n=1 Tax=Methyloprofundus sp. TaxID=2020875 RepID=UPI003D0FF6B0